MGKLPGLTFTIHQSTDRLRRQQDSIEDEIITTRKLVMGDPDADPYLTAHYGVVCASDPAAHLAGSSNPLVVSVNAQNAFQIDINPGIAMMSSGVWIELHNIVRQISLADTSVGTPNVVYLRYQLDSAAVEPNDFDDMVSPYTMRVGDPDNNGTVISQESVLIGVETVATYTQLSATVRADFCPLAIATVQTVTSGGVTVTQLSIDHTRASYSFNRPWFSPVDIEHRSMIGTGVVTTGNPHGTELSDLSVGSLSLFQLHLDHGMVVAKDRSVAKVPGYRCTTAVTTVSVDDAFGTVTGYGNASYIELPYYPVRLGRVIRSDTSETLAAILVPQTNRVVFPWEAPPAATTLSVYYTRVELLEPPIPNTTTFTTNGPATQELAISGGAGLASLSSTEETFADAYQMPMRYELFLSSDGELLKTPQVVYCYKRLDSLGTSDNADDITPYGPGNLMVGLLGATSTPTLDVQLRIYGKDTSGTAVNELFTFNTTNWSPVGAVPTLPIPTSTAVHFGTTVFATLDTITVESRTGDGPNSAVMVWMCQTPYSNYDKQADVLHVASVAWDGLRLAQVFDKRVIGTTLRDELTAHAVAKVQEFLHLVLAGGNQTIYVEDFLSPRYHSLEQYSELGQTAANYPTYQFSKQQVGLHGYYRSLGFPVNPASSTTWRVTLFGQNLLVDPWFGGSTVPNYVILRSYESGAWVLHYMTAVAGMPGTYETTSAGVPTRVQVELFPAQCTGYVIYG